MSTLHDYSMGVREAQRVRVMRARIEAWQRAGAYRNDQSPSNCKKPHLVLHVHHTCPDNPPAAYRYRWWSVEFEGGARTGNYRRARRALYVARNRLASGRLGVLDR